MRFSVFRSFIMLLLELIHVYIGSGYHQRSDYGGAVVDTEYKGNNFIYRSIGFMYVLL